VVLLNTDPSASFTVHPGDRIAQLLLIPVGMHAVEEREELADSTTDARAQKRASAGFGSTGGFAGATAGPRG